MKGNLTTMTTTLPLIAISTILNNLSIYSSLGHVEAKIKHHPNMTILLTDNLMTEMTVGPTEVAKEGMSVILKICKSTTVIVPMKIAVILIRTGATTMTMMI